MSEEEARKAAVKTAMESMIDDGLVVDKQSYTGLHVGVGIGFQAGIAYERQRVAEEENDRLQKL